MPARSTGRSRSGSGDSRRLLLGVLNAPLDFAHRVEILGDLRAIAGAELCAAAAPCRPSPSRGCCRSRAARRAARSGVPPSPNSRSNTTRGSASVGSGVVGEDHERLFCRRRRSRCRSCRPGRSDPCRARATESACPGRSASRRSDRPSSRAGSRCLRSASLWRSSETRSWPTHGCRWCRRSSARDS